ncbi:MAG TPA: hypothetical protein VGE07_00045 [Herpetosiphonaceae bacterium]
MIGHTFKTAWAAARYFLLGLAAAVLAAPQTGAESRRLLRERILALFDRALPTSQPHDDSEGAAQLDKQEYWESGVAPENHPVL